jgi:uncharacterized protein
MNRVRHFEIHAANPEKAATFYHDVFGWDIKEWVIPGIHVEEENRYWLVGTGPGEEPGINGGIVVRRGPAPTEGQAVNSYVCTIEVASVDRSIAAALKAGATVAVPKMAIRGVGWIAYCKDTEGNLFGVMENNQNAE